MSKTALSVLTAATELPLTLSEAKSYLKVTYNAEDSLINSLIAAATDWAQEYTRRIFIDTQVTIAYDRFPRTGQSAELVSDPLGTWFYVPRYTIRSKEAHKRDQSILLPGGKVTAVNEIRYADADGMNQTLTGPTSTVPGTDYREDLTDDEWAFVYRPNDVGWPGVDDAAVNAVVVDYQVGWPDASAMPESIRQAIRFKLADMFTVRDSVDANKARENTVAERLLDPYTVPRF